MTCSEALAEARKRWPNGWAQTGYILGKRVWFVGGWDRWKMDTKGKGSSYEAAFADAEWIRTSNVYRHALEDIQTECRRAVGWKSTDEMLAGLSRLSCIAGAALEKEPLEKEPIERRPS